MLLPSQLHEISRRYSAYVDEMREFLLHDGFPVNAPGAVAELSERLQQDARFRGDVSSLTRAVLYREREQIGYMELLGIVVLAAAGPRGASDGEEEAMRQTLRFLMQARRPLDSGREEKRAEAEAKPVRRAPLSAPPLSAQPQAARPAAGSVRPRAASKTEDEPAMAFLAAAEGEAPWWRTHAVWVVGFLGVMLGLGAGLMIRRGGSATNNGNTVASAGVPSAVTETVRSSARRVRSFGRSRKPSPGVPRASERAASEPAARVAAPVIRTAGPGAMHGTAAPANEASLGVQPMESGAGRRPQPMIAAARGNVMDRETIRAEFAHPAPRPAVASPAPAAPANTPSGSAAVNAPRTGSVRSGSAGIMAGNVMFSPAPMYPPAASAANVQGEVTVRAVVGKDGDVIDAHVVSGPPLLRDAALEAVERWRYRPYLQDGKPVAVATTAIVDFQIPGQGEPQDDRDPIRLLRR